MQTELQMLQALISLLLYEQPELGPHFLPGSVCPKTLEYFNSSLYLLNCWVTLGVDVNLEINRKKDFMPSYFLMLKSHFKTTSE